MAYDLQTAGDAFTLTLSGTVDLTETSNVKDLLKNEPKAGFKRLVIECGETEYMDSSAVALLLFAKRVAEESQMIFEIASISSSAKKIIEMAGLGAVFSLPAVSSPDAETDNGQDGAEADQEQEVSPADGGIEMDLSTDNSDDEIELNLPDTDTDTDTEPNLDFSEDTPTEDDFTMDFDEGEKGPDDSQVVDNKGETGENSQRGDDSGDSKSDDFEFKPGTFE
ncbi:STAS domain protein [beta proteobacterium KB13]|uniref:STAS domain protein n=1 Tax=beta proteobacterium KB13 TaxID=314607 RepID=B6BVW2_9PROT|nr:STAS domain protein [beta proteobacterium KB13]